MSFALATSNVAEEVRTAFYAVEVTASPSIYGSIKKAASAAIHQAADVLKSRGRAEIAASGFSSKWQNAWRVNVYPKSGESIDAAAFGYHKIAYSLVFENGGRIRARHGLLWIPLSTVPKNGRKRNFTAGELSQRGVNLFSINRPGHVPLLAANIRGTGGIGQAISGGRKTRKKGQRGRTATANRFKPTLGGKLISLATLRKGAKGKSGSIVTVPLFYGLSSVTIQKKFNIAGVGSYVASKVPDWYANSLEA